LIFKPIIAAICNTLTSTINASSAATGFTCNQCSGRYKLFQITGSLTCTATSPKDLGPNVGTGTYARFHFLTIMSKCCIDFSIDQRSSTHHIFLVSFFFFLLISKSGWYFERTTSRQNPPPVACYQVGRRMFGCQFGTSHPCGAGECGRGSFH
jgi:hypothetical protein